MKTLNLTVTEFAQLYGARPETVRQQLGRGATYPPILKVSRFGRAYKLTVLKSWVDAQKEYKNYMGGNNQPK
jgi:hypothetical protein